MERATDRPCTWAVQYLLPIHPDEVLALEVELGGQGRRLTQAQVTGRVEGRLVLVAHGSLGGSGRPTRSSCLLRRTCPLRRSAPAERCRSSQCEFDSALGVDHGCVEERHGRVLLPQEQADLSASVQPRMIACAPISTNLEMISL